MFRKFKILNLQTEKDGCQYVRHEIPLMELRSRGHYVKMEFPIHRMDWDLAVLSRQYSERTPETIFKMRAVGIKIVYDTDDLLFAIEPSNIFYSVPSTVRALRIAAQCIPMVDAITCTTQALADGMSKLVKKPTYVLPNSVRPADWKERPHQSPRLRIGYTGSVSHYRELNFLIPIIAKLQKKYDFEFHIFGIYKSAEDLQSTVDKKLDKEIAWHVLATETQRLLKTIEYTHHGYVETAQYMDKLSSLDLDIGLCPLFGSLFNDCKSPIKYFEYALVGTAPLCSDALPYADCPNKTEMDPHLWYDNIEAMIKSKEHRQAVVDISKDFVLENYDIKKTVVRWEEAYEDILKPTPTILRATSIPAGIGQNPRG